MLETTTLHNDMILSTLSIISHDFVFCFPKKPHTNGDVFLTYKSMINPLVNYFLYNKDVEETKIELYNFSIYYTR